MKTIVLSSTLVLIFASIAGSINDCNDPNFHSLETSETSKLRCGPAFKSLCHCMKTCYDGHHQYVVNCTNAGFYDTSPLAHLPNETQVRHVDKIKGDAILYIRDITLFLSFDSSGAHLYGKRTAGTAVECVRHPR